jgi:hypothetical protein
MFSIVGHEPIEVTLTGELTRQNVSNEIAYMYESELAVIVPQCESIVYTWFAKVDDVTGCLRRRRVAAGGSRSGDGARNAKTRGGFSGVL